MVLAIDERCGEVVVCGGGEAVGSKINSSRRGTLCGER